MYSINGENTVLIWTEFAVLLTWADVYTFPLLYAGKTDESSVNIAFFVKNIEITAKKGAGVYYITGLLYSYEKDIGSLEFDIQFLLVR